jgi:hypothetical protein
VGRGTLWGAPKKIDGPPLHLLDLEPTRPTTHRPTSFLLGFVFSAFWGVSRQGDEFKNALDMFLQNVHVGKKIKDFDKNFDVSFSPTFFLFYRVLGCFSAMGVQKHYKKRFTNKSTKNPKPIFPRFVLKTPQKI